MSQLALPDIVFPQEHVVSKPKKKKAVQLKKSKTKKLKENKVEEEEDSKVIQEEDTRKQPTLVYLPNREMMLRIMRACCCAETIEDTIFKKFKIEE